MISIFKITFAILFCISSIFSQGIVINEVMSSNVTTLTDEDGDYPDWIEVYNSSESTINLGGYDISDGENDPVKWTFPEVTVPPKGFLLVFASDKDRKEIAQLQTIIDWGDTWKYRIGDSEPPSNWRYIDFDDTDWLEGPSGFGYGDGDDSTIVEGAISLYIRKSFELDNIDNIQQALLHVDYDDGFVAYINGIEIARANINGNPPLFNQTAITYKEAKMYQGGFPEKFVIDDIQTLLKSGKNVISIQVHNVSTISSDLTIIPFLTLKFTSPPTQFTNGVSSYLGIGQPDLHTNFKIKSAGETLTLRDSNGGLSDSIRLESLPPDISFGRYPDGEPGWQLFAQPSPDSSNIYSEPLNIIESPMFSTQSGFYDTPIELSLSVNTPSATIYYTIDGAEPTESSTPYTIPITIDETAVIRARAFITDYLPSAIITQTYFINEEHTLPVISLATDPVNLWDEDVGIYVMGKNAEPENPHFGANFWQDWERPIHIEFFDANGNSGFSLNAGMKIYGGWSRAFDQKSVSIFERNKYDTKKIDYQIFPDKAIDHFEAIVLRNSGNDWTSTMFRDAMMQYLIKDNMDIEIQAYQPAIVYLNGEYWGIHNIREKINEHFIAANRNVDPEKIDLLENDGVVINGDNTDYNSLIEFLKDNDVQESNNYAYVKDQMNIDNFMNYMAAQIYFDNTDWPGNNVKYWRLNDPKSKWQWIIYDTDFGFGMYNPNAYSDNTLEFATAEDGPGWPNPDWSTFLLRTLLENETFRHSFINHFADHLNTTFAAGRVNEFIAQMKAGIESEMTRHRQKWSGSAGNWNGEIDRLRDFANRRVSYVREHIHNKFSLNGTIAVSFNISPAGSGKIQINSQTIREFPWNGTYFKNIPIEYIAVPNPGYRFVRWSDESLSRERTYNSISNLSVTAIFESATGNHESIVINEINYNSETEFDTEDWVEFYNNSGSTIDLSGWLFKDSKDTNVFAIPSETILYEDEYLVLCRDTASFTFWFPYVDNYLGNLDFRLSNGGELIRLFDSFGNIVDSLTYDDEAPWPTEPDGDGPTLALKDPSSDNSLPENWAASSGHGTPGEKNDVAIEIADSNLPLLPKKFTLEQNFPNPFNSTTVIRYALPEDGFVKLIIYDITGRTVSRLIETKKNSGNHYVRCEANVPSGIYFYKLDVQCSMKHFSQVRKMILIK